MADKIFTGTGLIDDTADYRYVKWVGRTKGGTAVSIVLPKAICLSNPDWAFNEKDDTVPEIEFTSCYEDGPLANNDRTEPWQLTAATGIVAGNKEIVLGVGKFYVCATGPDYSATATYAKDDIVVHNYKAYKAKAAIATAEAWTDEHWDEVVPTHVGLTRGGGGFVVEREYREINADDDPGPVYGRIVQEGGRPKLSFKMLQWLTKVGDIYPAMQTT